MFCKARSCICPIIVFAIVCSVAIGQESSQRATSAWFEVECAAHDISTESVIKLCEEVRAELFRTWCGDNAVSNWTPRCKVRIHASRTSYLQRIGAYGGQTAGCSSIELRNGTVVRREIDLLPNADGELSALPHELTHVVLADHFGGRQPPHWFDEGVAMIADTVEKQARHQRDCIDALSSGMAMTLQSLARLNSFKSPKEMPVFYGQSLLLVRMLSEKRAPTQLLKFANDSIDLGFENALKTHYSVNGLEDLEKSWRQYVYRDQSSAKLALAIRFKP